jgi:hypothetical protein
MSYEQWRGDDGDRRRLATSRRSPARRDTSPGQASLTVQNLAAEAGISRASAYRSPVLVEFRQCVANQEVRAPSLSSLQDENRGLRAELKELRSRHAAEAASLRADVDGLLQLVQVLTVEREALRRQLAQGGNVGNLDARRSSIAREG